VKDRSSYSRERKTFVPFSVWEEVQKHESGNEDSLTSEGETIVVWLAGKNRPTHRETYYSS
jgi:hypothetical protein